MRIAITGATGFLGRHLVERLHKDPMVERVVVLSRDEHKVKALADKYPEPHRLRWFVGDIRDRGRLEHAFRNTDVVIHAAALKRVDAVVNDSLELQKTNVDGTVNVLQAALECGVRKVMLISSDKAVQPTNAYGATKMLAELHTTGFNAYSIPRGMACSAVRYGNVMNSTGSVLHIWRDAFQKKRPLPLTSPEMTRFHFAINDAIDFVLAGIRKMIGGEIFIPNLRAYRMDHLAKAFLEVHDYFDCMHSKVEVVGARPGGEKFHEELLSIEEPKRTLFDGECLVVMPANRTWSANPYRGSLIDSMDSLKINRSSNQVELIEGEELRQLIEEYER